MDAAAFVESDLLSGGPLVRSARRLALVSGTAAAAMLALAAIAVASTDRPILLGPEGPVLVRQGAAAALFEHDGPGPSVLDVLAQVELVVVAVLSLGGAAWFASHRLLRWVEVCARGRTGTRACASPPSAEPFVIGRRGFNGLMEVQLVVAGSLWAVQAGMELAGVAPRIYRIRCGGCDFADAPSLSDIAAVTASTPDPAPAMAAVGRRLAYVVTVSMVGTVILLAGAAAAGTRTATTTPFVVATHVSILGGTLATFVAPENHVAGVLLGAVSWTAWALILINFVYVTLSAAGTPPPTASCHRSSGSGSDCDDFRVVLPSDRRFSDSVARLRRRLQQLCLSVFSLLFALTAVSAAQSLIWRDPEATPVISLVRFVLSAAALLLGSVDLQRLQDGADSALAQRSADKAMEQITKQQRRMVQYLAHEMHPALLGSRSLLAGALHALHVLRGVTDQPTPRSAVLTRRRRARDLISEAMDDIGMAAFSVRALQQPLQAITDDTGAVRERIHLCPRPFAPSVLLPQAAAAGSEKAALSRVRVRVQCGGLMAQRIGSGSASVAAGALRRALWRAQARGMRSAHVTVGDPERIAQGTRAVVRAAVSHALPESTVVVRLDSAPVTAPTLPPRPRPRPARLSLHAATRVHHGVLAERRRPQQQRQVSEADVSDVVSAGEHVRLTVEVLLIGDASSMESTIRRVQASGVPREEVQRGCVGDHGRMGSLSEIITGSGQGSDGGGAPESTREPNPVGDTVQSPSGHAIPSRAFPEHAEAGATSHELTRVAVAAVIINEMGGTLRCDRTMPQAAVDGWTTGPAWRIRLVLSLPAASPTEAADVTSLLSGPGADTPSQWKAARAGKASPSTSPSPSEGVPHIEGEGFLVEDEGKYVDEDTDEDEDGEDGEGGEEEEEIARFDEASE